MPSFSALFISLLALGSAEGTVCLCPPGEASVSRVGADFEEVPEGAREDMSVRPMFVGELLRLYVYLGYPKAAPAPAFEIAMEQIEEGRPAPYDRKRFLLDVKVVSERPAQEQGQEIAKWLLAETEKLPPPGHYVLVARLIGCRWPTAGYYHRIKPPITSRERAIVHLRRAWLAIHETASPDQERAIAELRNARREAGIWRPYIGVAAGVHIHDRLRGGKGLRLEYCADAWAFFRVPVGRLGKLKEDNRASLEAECGPEPKEWPPPGAAPFAPEPPPPPKAGRPVVPNSLRQSSDYIVNRSVRAIAERRFEEARTLLSEARRMYGDALDVLDAEALLARCEKRWEDAIRIYEELDRRTTIWNGHAEDVRREASGRDRGLPCSEPAHDLPGGATLAK